MPGEAALIEGVIFPDGPSSLLSGRKGIRPSKNICDGPGSGRGDVWYPLESGHQEGGIGVLEMSAYHTAVVIKSS